MGKKTHGSIHHIRPISRGGKKIPENEINISPAILHEAWHTLFGNDTIEEVIAKIKYAWSDNHDVIKEEYLLGVEARKKGKTVDKRLSAWKAIFGDTQNAKEAIRIIKATFTKRT